ncbi:MAG: hypothetical protein LBN32_00430 [Helicobacteraceae bacterium]|jgi:hypothetical protein|nr:hypothetical protein [Helicobacteraceae bacterium]
MNKQENEQEALELLTDEEEALLSASDDDFELPKETHCDKCECEGCQ